MGDSSVTLWRLFIVENSCCDGAWYLFEVAIDEKQIVKMKAELIQIAASVSVGRRGTDRATISKRIERVFGSKDAAKFF